MVKMLICAAGLAILCGCGTVQKVDVGATTKDVKTVAFVQNGRHAKQLMVGAVDGKTFWAGANVIGVPANPASRADQTAAIGATLVSLIGSAIAQAAIDADLQQYQRVLDQMIGSRELSLDAGRVVLPALADAWGVPYADARLSVLPETVVLNGPNNRYAGADPGADLVLAFTLSRITFTEKPSVGGLFETMLTLGLNDKEVRPMFHGELAAFRRSRDGHLDRVWTTECFDSFVDAATENWGALAADPARGGAMLDMTLPRFAAACAKASNTNLVAAK